MTDLCHLCLAVYEGPDYDSWLVAHDCFQMEPTPTGAHFSELGKWNEDEPIHSWAHSQPYAKPKSAKIVASANGEPLLVVTLEDGTAEFIYSEGEFYRFHT